MPLLPQARADYRASGFQPGWGSEGLLGSLPLLFPLREFQCTTSALLVPNYLFKFYILNQFTYPLQVDWVVVGAKEDLSTLVRVTHNTLLYHALYLIHVRQYAIQHPGQQWAR